uniref:Uncharacterized protein n=2 Tax=Guillardia theta TaxID=55529 RepID=A0A7S4KEL1_GUITH|mmetsp:Transcript_23653/g.77000  ORF Transcript_23653/g.77000 Transcript_23653/m.77000 type:complete len:178 (+) Transcript_23653:375-908(+)
MARSKGSDTPLLKKGRWQSHYVNGLPFTIALATFALVAVGGVIMLSAMLVSGSAKEAQELLPAAPPSLHSNVYGAKHEGVGFANYVVGNAVSSFWKKEMGKSGPKKMSDPFASFLLPNKQKKSRGSASTPEEEADDAQQVDEDHQRIGRARATKEAIRHAKDVAEYHKRQGSAAVGH